MALPDGVGFRDRFGEGNLRFLSPVPFLPSGRNRPGAIIGAFALSVAVSCVGAKTWGAIPASAQERRQAATTRTLADEVGRKVLIPARVRRIVSLSPDSTETIYALGLGDRLAGDTTFCTTPPEAAKKPHVGSPQEPSVEAVLALHPDLVLASRTINRAETVQALAEAGVAVYVTDPHSVEGTLLSILDIAEAAGAQPAGEALVARLRPRLDSLRRKLAGTPPVRVFFVVWENPLISIGQDTFVADELRYAGAESVIRTRQNWPQIDMEEILRLQPEYIIYAPEEGRQAEELAALREQPGWSSLRAAREGHVLAVSDAINRPSVGIVDVIEQLARALHPAAFASSGRGQGEQRAAPGTRAIFAAMIPNRPEPCSCVR